MGLEKFLDEDLDYIRIIDTEEEPIGEEDIPEKDEKELLRG